MNRTNFNQKIMVAAATLFAVTMTFASCEKPADDPAGGGTLTLANSPGAGSEVYVTDYALSADTEYADVVADNIAHGTIKSDNTCDFSQWKGSNTGTFNVLVKSPETTRAGESTLKYQNGVQFTDGAASLNWNGMTIIAGVGAGYADILTFTFDGIVGEAVIDPDALTVTATADETVNLEWIITKFTLSAGATARSQHNNELVSGQAAIDFTEPQIFKVTSSDGSLTNIWTVTVTKEGETTDDWSLPENLKVTVSWSNDEGDTPTNIITKIGENYLCQHPGTYQTFLKQTGSNSWTFFARTSPSSDWYINARYNSREDMLARLGGQDFMFYLIPLLNLINDCPVTGTATLIGRSVTVREGMWGKFWMDDEYNVCLKLEDFNDGEVSEGFTVTQWDETVEDFGEIALPE